MVAGLIGIAQRAPDNWLGKQLSQMARKLVVMFGRLPIDIEIGDIRMRCYLRDNNSERKFAFMPGRFDPHERRLLLEALPRQGCFVDIGANVGIYTLAVATHLGAGGRILALEPNPPAFERLVFNVEATRAGRAEWPRVDAVALGIDAIEGEIDLHLDPENLGGSSVATHAAVAARTTGGSVRIACRPLLALLREHAIEHVDALKIDIEGAEDAALLPYLRDANEGELADCMIIENSEPLWRQDLVGALHARGYRAQLRARMNTVYRREKALPRASDAAQRG